jgi:ABC-type multidrug transport system ATPase subunit
MIRLIYSNPISVNWRRWGESMAAIEISGLVKDYGDVKALKGLDMTVDKGMVYGFCGPNGAGKTTTLKILIGLIYPTSGSAKIMDMDVIEQGTEVRKHIGYLPESYGLPRWETPRKFLTYMGVLSGMRRDELKPIIEEKAEKLGFSDLLNKRIKGISKGNKQKIGIAQALIHDPDIILFDEPTTGLDPIGRNDILNSMKEFSKEGKTILFSTHILSDVEKICDKVGIIHKGSLIVKGEPDALKKEYETKDLDEIFMKVAGHG